MYTFTEKNQTEYIGKRQLTNVLFDLLNENLYICE